MKHFLCFFILIAMISCGNKKSDDDKDLKKELHAMSENFNDNKIDLKLHATPKYFSAPTVSGKLFNSKDYKEKILVVFIYDKSYLEKTENYDMSAELNEIYNLYKDKAQFIGIIEGFIDDNTELQKTLKNSKIAFDQIDNTIAPNKEEKVIHNISCEPAKIVIDQTGKVIVSSCGGKNNDELNSILEKL